MTNTPITISVPQVIRALELAVDKAGKDFVYVKPDENFGCVYVLDGAPSCLVGNALHRLGVPIEQLKTHNTVTANTLMEYLSGEGIIETSERATEVLRAAQSIQDQGYPWGAALLAAKMVSHAFGSNNITTTNKEN